MYIWIYGLPGVSLNLAETPFLNDVEKACHGKKIAFSDAYKVNVIPRFNLTDQKEKLLLPMYQDNQLKNLKLYLKD